MKKYFIISINTLIFIGALSLDAFSQVNWIKYPGNPVLTGIVGEWDARHVTNPKVIKDEEEGIYKMWYSGCDFGVPYRIGYATSVDGITWEKYEGNPILNVGSSGTWEDGGVVCITVIKEAPTTYKMWYLGMKYYGYHDLKGCIGYATSSDGINWVKYEGNPVLDVGILGSWDGGSLENGWVMKDGDTYKMWYSGDDERSIYYTNFKIGYATSPDGISWVKFEGNPVLDLGEDEWESGTVMYPMVMKEDALYKMWYSGSDPGGHIGHFRIGYATSPDGINWVRYEGNPVLDLSKKVGDWDYWDVFMAMVLKEDTIYKMWFSGMDEMSFNMKMFTGYALSCEGDNDCDSIPDNTDNCPNVYNPHQEDTFPPQSNGIGDACDCEGNFDCDRDVDSADVATFLQHFGRNPYNRPCTSEDPCTADFSCDGDVDAQDVTKFLEDFGRSQYNNPCPVCEAGIPWCHY